MHPRQETAHYRSPEESLCPYKNSSLLCKYFDKASLQVWHQVAQGKSEFFSYIYFTIFFRFLIKIITRIRTKNPAILMPIGIRFPA